MANLSQLLPITNNLVTQTDLTTSLASKVTGAAATSSVGGDLKLYEATANGTNYVSFKAPNTLAGNVTWVLPTADGTNGQVLRTDGAGNLSWSTGSSQWVTSGSNIYYSAGKVSFNTSTAPADTTVYMAGNNETTSPDKLLSVQRGYTVHPGKTTNYFGIHSVIAGVGGAGTATIGNYSAIYGEANGNYTAGVIGKSGLDTGISYGVMGWGFQGDTNGYGAATGLHAYLTQSGLNPGNGLLQGLLITTPNYNNNRGIVWENAYTGSNTQNFAVINRNGTTIGSISTTTTATAYNTSSDYRLKDDIQPMTGALARVAALKPVTYKWKADGSGGEGFIAHELQAVCPEAVTGVKDEVEEYFDDQGVAHTRPKYQGIDTSFLVATLTAAIQELKAELDSVKGELALLKNQ